MVQTPARADVGLLPGSVLDGAPACSIFNNHETAHLCGVWLASVAAVLAWHVTDRQVLWQVLSDLLGECDASTAYQAFG
jgi:hypothetical protein